MKLTTLCELLEATCICGHSHNEIELERAFASDLMSDVLTLDSNALILITGLCNLQTIRTADMADINCILFVRDKRPSTEMIRLAEESHIVLLRTRHSTFYSCGILFSHGLKSIF